MEKNFPSDFLVSLPEDVVGIKECTMEFFQFLNSPSTLMPPWYISLRERVDLFQCNTCPPRPHVPRMESIQTYNSTTIFHVKHIKGKGRSLIALTKIKEGDLIVTENPFALSSRLESVLPKIDETLQLAIHWWLQESEQIQKQCEAQTDSLSSDEALCSSLDSHITKRKDEFPKLLMLALQGLIVIEKNGWVSVPSSSLLWTLFIKLCQITVNTIAIYELSDAKGNSTDNLVHIGRNKLAIGLYPLLSMTNHDCNPNGHLVFDTFQCNLRASRDIAPGEEISISYGCLASKIPKPQRQDSLVKNYFFQCCCISCLGEKNEDSKFRCPSCSISNNNTTLLFESSGHHLFCPTCSYKNTKKLFVQKEKQASKYLLVGDKLLESGGVGQAIRAFEECLRSYYSLFLKNDYRIGKVHDRLGECFASQNDFENAATHVQQSVDIIVSIFGKNAVETVNELVKLCELYFAARNIPAALRTIDQADTAAVVCYGRDNNISERLTQMKKFLLCKQKQLNKR